ncbi:uncharacterized protein LOC141596464 [Silene latifolia]|uniref:uncharacterized protein LOC141596464 n=1 Tax=Silene latifolia TaxID=37657 RepID=UPI003D786D1F
MEIGKDLDDFIKNSIDHTLGLTIPNQNLELKLESLETTNYRLRHQYLLLQSKLKEKETALHLAREEASMNAQAIKKFVDENQKLASECKFLMDQCNKWEQECSLYDHDREKLMEFGNEADERAKEAEIRVNGLEEELKSVTDQLKYYKHQYESLSDDSSVDGPPSEQILLNALVASLVNKSEVPKTASAFLEVNSSVETCRNLLEMWNSLRPETQNILSLAGSVKTLQKAKEHLKINLTRAEEEVSVLAAENNALVEENRRLLKFCHSKRKHGGSEDKHDSSARTKSNKRKTSPGISDPIDRKLDFSDKDSQRYPLSPLKQNSPGSKSPSSNEMKNKL